MNLKKFSEFQRILVNNKILTSELEYTNNNYDHHGELIKQKIPTYTTNNCEIGLFHGEIYFVFIIRSKDFNLKLFKELKDNQYLKIYGFVDFNKTLYPNQKFNLNDFTQEIKKDRFLQFQFDYKKIEILNLFKEYLKLVNIFKKHKIKVINQLKIKKSEDLLSS